MCLFSQPRGGGHRGEELRSPPWSPQPLQRIQGGAPERGWRFSSLWRTEIGHAAKGLARSLGKGPVTLFMPSTSCCRFPTPVISIRQVSALQPSGFVVGKVVQTFLASAFPKKTP